MVPCSLAPQASPWGAMDGAAAGALGAPTLSGGQAGSNPVSALVNTSQPSLSNWGISSSGISPGDSSSHHAQQWMPSSGRNGAREMAGAWQQWPAHSGELALAADNKVAPLAHGPMPQCPVLTIFAVRSHTLKRTCKSAGAMTWS